ncbi:MAG TPA: hypothetical protein VER96_21180 [Polyangiaceae bacterium]|nr:hypothetical protein [Polyangiaceae bacterium]
MDSPTGFDDDDFFGSYDAERAHAATSIHPHELDDAGDRPPTEEQLAHWGRFRKPVGLVVGAMAFLSLVALAKRGSIEATSEHPLVAHYSSAIAAPTQISSASEEPIASVEASATTPDSSSDFFPEDLSALVSEVWSVFVPNAPVASTTVPLLVTDEVAPEPHADPDVARAFLPPAPPTPMCSLPAQPRGATLESNRTR